MGRHLLCSAILLLSGCASTTVLMVGAARPAIKAAQVRVYTAPPKHYEVIGIVTSRSNGGWTDQGKLDNALDGLKSQAADIGANGLLLEQSGTVATGGVAVGNSTGPSAVFVGGAVQQAEISAQAIYVPDNE